MLLEGSRIFGRRGFDDASMTEIAEAAGITKPMLYAYFGSKEGLFTACVRDAAARVRERVKVAAEQPGLSTDARLWAALLEVFSFVDEHREAWRVLYSAGRFEAAAEESRQGMEQVVAGLFTQAAGGEVPADHLRELATGFTAATIAMATSWADGPGEPKEVAALRLMNMMWGGFERMLGGELWLPPEASR